MADLVRVRLENGVEKNVGAEFAKMLELEVLDEPTHRPDGSIRPPTRAHGRPVKRRTSVAKAAAAKQEKAPAPATSTPEEASA